MVLIGWLVADGLIIFPLYPFTSILFIVNRIASASQDTKGAPLKNTTATNMIEYYRKVRVSIGLF